MTYEQREARDKAFRAIEDYLNECGWLFLGDLGDFQWSDPVTNQSHRLDFAFVIQTERDFYEEIEKQKQRAQESP